MRYFTAVRRPQRPAQAGGGHYYDLPDGNESIEVILDDPPGAVDTGLLDAEGSPIFSVDLVESVPFGFHFYGRPTKRTRKKARR